jgi:hypothetical protein
MTAKHPPISWSQLKDSVSLIIGVQDAQNVKIDIEAFNSTSLLKISLTNLAKNELYSCDLKLFAPVEPALSSQEIKARGVYLTLMKKKSNEVWFWPRLTLDKVKNQNITIDWNTWKDEDDLEKSAAPNFSAGGGSSGMMMNDLDFLRGGGGDTGGLSLESEEIQKTLAALREEQIKLKKEELLSGKGTSKERRQMIEELQRDQMENELLKNVPKFGSAANQQPLQQHEDDDDEDELPPLV